MLGNTISAAALVLAATLQAAAQDGRVIEMGTMAWEDLTPITGITKKVLEDAGYTVNVTEFAEWGIAYTALARGDVQILASQTDYVAHDYWDRNKSRLEKISPVSHGLVMGIAVPRYMAINSIEDLNDNAAELGNRIVGIEPGSGLMRDTATVVGKYGLQLQLVDGSTAAMTAALRAAVEREEPIAVTIWEPSWMMQAYDVKFLADPKGVYPPAQSYYWIGEAGFSAENPHARELLASVYVPLADINSINGAVSDGQTMDEAVAAWTEENADLLSRWSNIKSE